MSGRHEIIPISDTSPAVFDPEPSASRAPHPDMWQRREAIAAQAMAALLSRVDGKLPVQEGDQDRWVAGAANLGVKAADALLKALNDHTSQRNTP
jgi:hypothetical protein